jgi:hypothetical protein
LRAAFISVVQCFGARYWQILLQKDFWPRSEERFFQIEREGGIMIQESGCLDSIIAHFCPSGRQAATFATVSATLRLEHVQQCA